MSTTDNAQTALLEVLQRIAAALEKQTALIESQIQVIASVSNRLEDLGRLQ